MKAGIDTQLDPFLGVTVRPSYPVALNNVDYCPYKDTAPPDNYDLCSEYLSFNDAQLESIILNGIFSEEFDDQLTQLEKLEKDLQLSNLDLNCMVDNNYNQDSQGRVNEANEFSYNIDEQTNYREVFAFEGADLASLYTDEAKLEIAPIDWLESEESYELAPTEDSLDLAQSEASLELAPTEISLDLEQTDCESVHSYSDKSSSCSSAPPSPKRKAVDTHPKVVKRRKTTRRVKRVQDEKVKNQNKIAAMKYRNKKRGEKYVLDELLQDEEGKNKKLKAQLEELEVNINVMKELLGKYLSPSQMNYNHHNNQH